MKTETEKELELKELNEWVSIHVLSWQKKRCAIHLSYDCCGRKRMPNPTTNPADALAVWRECLDRCDAETAKVPSGFRIRRTDVRKDQLTTFGSTLEITICLFVRQLFSK